MAWYLVKHLDNFVLTAFTFLSTPSPQNNVSYFEIKMEGTFQYGSRLVFER